MAVNKYIVLRFNESLSIQPSDDTVIRYEFPSEYYDLKLVVNNEIGCQGCAFNNDNIGSFNPLSSHPCPIEDFRICVWSNKKFIILNHSDTNDNKYCQYIHINKIKSVICNQDTCPYYSESCIDNVLVNDELSCLLKRLIK